MVYDYDDCARSTLITHYFSSLPIDIDVPIV